MFFVDYCSAASAGIAAAVRDASSSPAMIVDRPSSAGVPENGVATSDADGRIAFAASEPTTRNVTAAAKGCPSALVAPSVMPPVQSAPALQPVPRLVPASGVKARDVEGASLRQATAKNRVQAVRIATRPAPREVSDIAEPHGKSDRRSESSAPGEGDIGMRCSGA